MIGLGTRIGAQRARTASQSAAKRPCYATCMMNSHLVARAGREIPAVIDALRSGQVHLAGSRHIPDWIKRTVYDRDGGRCTFTDDRGRRCAETGGLEFDHLDGFARTHSHDVDRIRLRCRAHNQHAAEQTASKN